MSAVSLGIDATLNSNSASFATPTWAAMGGVADLAYDPVWKESESSGRGSLAERTEKTMVGLTITGRIRVDSTDTNGYLAMLAALNSRTPMDLAVMDGPLSSSTSNGYRAGWHVFGGKKDVGLDKVTYMEFTLKPSALQAFQLAVGGATPSFTTI